MGVVRAFADDTAITIKDVRQLGPILVLFQEYAQISNLELDIKKTVIIPLFGTNITEAKQYILAVLPECAHMVFDYASIYLGIMLGPESELRSWEKPILKFLDRVLDWGRMKKGTFLGLRAYSTYCFSVLQFYAQFIRGPQTWRWWTPKLGPHF